MDIQDREDFKDLIDRKAPCLEMALNGYIRIDEGVMRCTCFSCEAARKHPIPMPKNELNHTPVHFGEEPPKGEISCTYVL